jgi:outer membrane receptor protein involved in Fe transport
MYDLAFTDNPALKPERTRSFEAGIEQKFAGDKLVVDGTYFYNRYYDLIVILGGSLSVLSHYESDNIANSEAQGAEMRAQYRPARWLFVTGSYTHLATEILALNGTSDLAPVRRSRWGRNCCGGRRIPVPGRRRSRAGESRAMSPVTFAARTWTWSRLMARPRASTATPATSTWESA